MSGDNDRSGRVLLRMPASLHALAAAEAERDGVSLNQFLVGVIAGATRWRAEDQPPVRTEAERAELGRQMDLKASSATHATGWDPGTL